jgi:peroxiredoxin Q/BCP
MSTRSSTVSVGSPAPDFTLAQVGGGEVTLSDLRGRPVVLVFLRGFV